jgi:ATP-binding cassette subfamily B protein
MSPRAGAPPGRSGASGAGAHAGEDDEVLGKAYDARLVRRLLPWIRPHRGLLALSLFLLLAVTCAQLAQPWLLKQALDGPVADALARPAGLHPDDLSGLGAIALMYALALGAELLLRWFQVVNTEKIGQNVVYDLRTHLFGHLQTLSSDYFDRNPVGRLMTRVTSDVEALSEFFSLEVATILVDVVKLVAIVGILLALNWRLACVSFLVVPVLAGLSHWFRSRLRDTYRHVRTRVARINSALQETISGIRVIQLFQAGRRQGDHLDRLNSDHRDADLRSVWYDSLFSAVVEMVGTVSGALILWYGGGEIVRGALTFGTLVAFLEYSNRFFVPIRDLSAKYSVLQATMASSERIFALLDTVPSIVSPVPAAALPVPAEGAIEFRDVWFAYRPGDWVLKGVSFTVRPGERVALVGATGSGKTSIIRLLIRLYDIQRGSIRLDGVDVRESARPDLRRRVGIVLQDHYLFQGTIERNLTMGDPRITSAAAREAAVIVGADPFIRALPAGYDEEVRERGNNFSAGQKQLLSFARALAYDPAVLVLDEATSSVDSETERQLQAALARLVEQRTSLIVAHRLSTVTGCDRILVLHHGELREQGTHEELLRAGGLYSTLCRLQFGAD